MPGLALVRPATCGDVERRLDGAVRGRDGVGGRISSARLKASDYDSLPHRDPLGCQTKHECRCEDRHHTEEEGHLVARPEVARGSPRRGERLNASGDLSNRHPSVEHDLPFPGGTPTFDLNLRSSFSASSRLSLLVLPGGTGLDPARSAVTRSASAESAGQILGDLGARALGGRKESGPVLESSEGVNGEWSWWLAFGLLRRE